jgi:D-sedoheptulose 7-phosphate isomerase
VAALTGERESRLSELASVCVRVPAVNTARVQESHLVCIHLLCAAVEAAVP